jgi:hypothetical protein
MPAIELKRQKSHLKTVNLKYKGKSNRISDKLKLFLGQLSKDDYGNFMVISRKEKLCIYQAEK